jgi:hypothetical protein
MKLAFKTCSKTKIHLKAKIIMLSNTILKFASSINGNRYKGQEVFMKVKGASFAFMNLKDKETLGKTRQWIS